MLRCILSGPGYIGYMAAVQDGQISDPYMICYKVACIPPSANLSGPAASSCRPGPIRNRLPLFSGPLSSMRGECGSHPKE